MVGDKLHPIADCSSGFAKPAIRANYRRVNRAAASLFELFYTRSRESNGFFTAFTTIVSIMSNWSRLRQIILGLVVLVAVAHANLATDLTGRAPNTYGMTRLGRDLLRKSTAEPCARPDHICTFFTDLKGDPTTILRLPL
jgi:hypothetical protein